MPSPTAIRNLICLHSFIFSNISRQDWRESRAFHILFDENNPLNNQMTMQRANNSIIWAWMSVQAIHPSLMLLEPFQLSVTILSADSHFLSLKLRKQETSKLHKTVREIVWNWLSDIKWKFWRNNISKVARISKYTQIQMVFTILEPLWIDFGPFLLSCWEWLVVTPR